MSKRHKMLAGAFYDAGDAEPVRARRRARGLTRRFNASGEDDDKVRTALLAELFGSLGTGCVVEPPFHCDYGTNISLGDRVEINFNCVILDCAPVTIGDRFLFGLSVQLYAAHHPVSPAERLRGRELASPIAIGENAWIGGGAIICPGVTIGANTTIGAGSIVVDDLPADVLAVGNPCRVVRRL